MTPDRQAQKIAYLEGVIERMGKAQERLKAAMETATAYTWTTADGRDVSVEPLPGFGWFISIDGALTTPDRRELGATLDLAARIAPPADAELAALLTWTACGNPRA